MMRMISGKGLLVGWLAFAACGHAAEKVFYFTHLDTQQAMQEVTNLVRGVGDIRDVSLDVAKRSLTVQGTAEQISAAAWLTGEMDKAESVPGARDFSFSDPKAPLAQVVYLSHVDNPREFQDVVNAIRSAIDIQRCFPMGQQKAIVLRGPADQVKAADWLLGVLDQPAGVQAAAAGHDYRLAEADWNARGGLVLRAAFLTNVDTPQALQEITNGIRSMADIQRCYPNFSHRVLVMRGTDEQMALVEWLVNQFNAPAGLDTKEYKVSGTVNQIVQLAHVDVGAPESLSATISEISTKTKMTRVFPLPARSAVAMRGTADQLAQAQQVIQSRQAK
jgi:hypothetical protein